MKELDVILSAYLEQHYPDANDEQRRQFHMLLEMQDPELYNLLLGRSREPEPQLEPMVEFLRGMVSRSRQGS